MRAAVIRTLLAGCHGEQRFTPNKPADGTDQARGVATCFRSSPPTSKLRVFRGVVTPMRLCAESVFRVDVVVRPVAPVFHERMYVSGIE